jgi:hypothetical protein
MVNWDNDYRRSPAPARVWEASAAPFGRAARQWQARLRRDLLAAGILCGAAHLVFAVCGMGRGLPLFSLPALTADLLFLLGTIPLWRLTRTLNEPVGQPREAACCLAAAMALSFSPCLWLMASRLL